MGRALSEIEIPRRGPGGDRKAPWSPPQRRKLLRNRKKRERLFSLALHKKSVSCGLPSASTGGRRRFPKGDRKALWSPPQRRNPLRNREKQGSSFPLPSTRNQLLVGGFVRLRADEVLSPHGKVPKGCRGRPKGACLMAAPGPPVAKQQCTASLAGARPAGFTSVPGRATVAFGAADPSPGSPAPVYPWSVGKGPLRQNHLAAVRAPAPGPCKVRARPGTRLVAGPRPNQMACPIRTLSVKKQGEVPLSGTRGVRGYPSAV